MRSTMRGLVTIVAALSPYCIGSGSPANAADFYAIAANLTNVKKPEAHVEVSANIDAAPMGTNISFTVFKNGAQLADFTVPTNANGFASSASATPPNDNLLKLSGGDPVLVRARTPSSATTAHAILRQTLASSKIIVGIQPFQFSIGRVFPLTFGDVAHRAILLVGNISGSDVNMDVFLGSVGCAGCGRYNRRIGDSEVAVVEIDPADARSHLIIVSSGDTLAQFAVDTGKKTVLTEMTMVPLD